MKDYAEDVAGSEKNPGAEMVMSEVAIEGCTTISTLFQKRGLENKNDIALKEKNFGLWESFTWGDYYHTAQIIGAQLFELGVQKGDAVAILSQNNKEWLFCDMAVVCCGAITSGIYPTDAPKQVLHILEDSGAAIVFVEDEEQLDKVLEIRDQAAIKKIVVFDWQGLLDFSDPQVESFSDFIQHGRTLLDKWQDRWRQRITSALPSDVAALVYTSGTTGSPKGAMITHRNLLSQIKMTVEVIPPVAGDRQVSFLPLCHIAEKVISIVGPLHSKATIHFVEELDTLVENMQEVSPTIFFAVPRVWEKMYSMIHLKMKEATWLGRISYHWTLRAGYSEHRWAQLAFRILRPIVLRNIRIILGFKETRLALSSAAPIAPDLLKWLETIGIPILEIFGQTESSGIATANLVDDNARGTIGKPLPGTAIKLSDDSEIMIKGSHVFAGYWRQPEKTAETVRNGWLLTGDIGRWTPEGFLQITGRKKDLIITSGGKNVSPAEIETVLKCSPFIVDVVLVGDQRKYLTALVMLDGVNVEKYAQELNLVFTDFASLCRLPEVFRLIRDEIDEVNKNFSRVEQIKDFRLIDQLLHAEDEELTATMKLKRRVVTEKYSSLIESMYASY